MKNFKPRFEAMHAAAEGDMTRAKELLKKKIVEEKPLSSSQSWFAEMEEREEAAAEKFRRAREAAQKEQKA